MSFLVPIYMRPVVSDYWGEARKAMLKAYWDLRARDAVVTSGAVSSWPNAGSGGSAYDLDTYLGTAGAIRKQPANSLLLDGVSGSYVSAPDSPANSVTGDCILFGYVEPVDNTPTISRTIISKLNDYILTVDSSPTGYLEVYFSDSLAGAHRLNSTLPIPYADGIGYWAIAKFVAGASVEFFTSTASPTSSFATVYASASSLGAVVPTTCADIKDSANPIQVGSWNSVSPFNGLIQRAGIIDGLDPTATPSVDFNPTNVGNLSGTDSATFVSTDGATYTLHGNARISDHDTVQFLGGAALESTVGVTVETPMTLYTVAKVDELTGAIQVITTGRSDSSNGPYWHVNTFNNLQFNAGSTLYDASADTDAHLLTARHNGDGTSAASVDGGLETVGNAGAENYDYGTLGANVIGTSTLSGSIARHTGLPKVNDVYNSYLQLNISRISGL